MLIAMVVFWAVIISIVVVAVRYLVRNARSPGQEVATSWGAEGVWAERYARGESDDDEYRQRLTVLTEHRTAS